MLLKAVLFDLFDTLILLEAPIYSSSLRKLHLSLKKNGIKVPFEDFRETFSEVNRKINSETKITLEDPHFNLRIVQTLHIFGYVFEMSDPIIAYASDAYTEESMRHMKLDPEAKHVLEKIHERFKLGLVSNLSFPEVGWKILEKYSLKNFFDVIVISGDVNVKKPSPRIFRIALDTLGVNASETFFVGDTVDLDIVGPKKVGMRTILIKRKPIEKMIVQSDRVISHLRELLSILE